MNESQIERIEIVEAQPEAVDRAVIEQLETERRTTYLKRSWVVKVYLKAPLPIQAVAHDLYIGDQRITAYSTFPGGVFFIVNDPERLAALAGGGVALRDPRDTSKRIRDQEHAFPSAVQEAPNTGPLPRQHEVFKGDQS